MKNFTKLFVIPFLVSPMLMAEGQEHNAATSSKVSSAASTSKLTVDTRFDAEYNDHGIMKTSASKPEKTMMFGVQWLTADVSGNLNDKVSYQVRLNPLNAKMFDYAYTKLKMGHFSVLAGQNKVHQGGVFQRRVNYLTLDTNPYLALLPLSGFQGVMEFGYEMMGYLSLQLTNDATTATTGSWSTTNSQPAWILAWEGSVGKVKPMVALGAYDKSHSKFVSLGAEAEFGCTEVVAEYIMDNRSTRDSTGKAQVGKISSMSLEVSYEVHKTVRPFLAYYMMDYVEAPKDLKANTTPSLSLLGGGRGHHGHHLAAAAGEGYNMNDNGSVVSVGAFVTAFGEHNPYFSFTRKSGLFFKPGTTDTESKAETSLHLGVSSRI